MMGIVYIIQFSEKISGRAEFYIGWAKNLDKRFSHHCNGTGARLTQVAVERGIGMKIVFTMPGTKTDERKLKNRKSARRFLLSQGVTL